MKDTFCIPKHASDFVKIVQLSFDDTEDFLAPGCITEADAQKIVTTLLWARQSNCHVVVHCHAGIARSGAVVEFATHLGFTALDHRWRWPNTLVLSQLDYFFQNSRKYCLNPIDVFTVMAYRGSSNSTHHYLVGVYSTLALAQEAATIEEAYRAGKYRCTIQASRLDHCSPESSMPNLNVTACRAQLELRTNLA